MNDLDSAIYSLLSADGTLSATATGGVHRIVAPEGTVGVYLVYQMIGALNDQHTIKTDRRISTLRYQIKAIERGYSASNAKTAMERVDALLNDGALSTGGTTLLVCRREAPIPDIVERLDNEEVYQHVGATYLVEVQL